VNITSADEGTAQNQSVRAQEPRCRATPK